MKRKLLTVMLSLVAALCLCLGLAACGGSNEDDGHEHVYTVENKCSVCGKEWEYTDGLEYSYDQEADTYTVTGIGTASGDIVIPYGYEGKSVTKVGAQAFENCTSLKGVTIPGSVTEIEEMAFHYSDLTTLTLGNGLVKIGWGAFYNCHKLTGEVMIPDSVTSLMEGAFMNCTELTKVTIGNGVATIHFAAFSNCFGLTQVVIGTNVSLIETDYSDIGESCDEEGLERLIFSQVMQGTMPDAFASCGKLWEVWNFSKLDIQAGSYENGQVAVCAKHVYTTNEAGKQTITDDGFVFYEDGDEVYLHQYCGNQTALTLPAKSPSGKNYTIYQSAFASRASLTSVILSAGVTEIGGGAFAFCTELTDITIPEGVTKIGGGAFAYCPALTGITIPGSVTEIGERAFAASGLSRIEIPGGVLEVGKDVFSGCDALTEITVSDANPNYSDEGGILYNKAKTEIIAVPQGISGAIVLPGSVTEIGEYAFSGCTSLTAITIPAGVTSIGECAFFGCTSLTAITIPAGVTSIEHGAFFNCTSLTNITIPEGVTEIGDSAFSGCTSLANIAIPDSVTSIGDWIFDDCTSLASVTIGSGITELAQNTFYECPVLTSITVSDANPNYSSENGILYNKTKTQIVAVPKGIKGAITLPDQLAAVAGSAFSGCTGLTGITIPESVTEIGSSAFYGCTGLTGITIPESVTEIGSSAFSGCTSLANITIPDIAISIGGNAFGNTAYYNDASKWDQDGVLYIGNHLIWANRETVRSEYVIRAGTKTIADYSFGSCISLTKITIPESMALIGNNVFSGCQALTDIQFGGTVDAWQELMWGISYRETFWRTATVTCSNGTWPRDRSNTL